MKKALRDLFSSKKFLVMLASIAAYAAARAGFDVSQAEAEKVLGLAAVWLGAQGLADLGKSKSLGEAFDAAPVHADLPRPNKDTP